MTIRWRWSTAVVSAGLVAALAVPAGAGEYVDDDLAVVQRALEREASVREDGPRRAPQPTRWLRLRVRDKRDGQGRVSINVPLPPSVLRSLPGELSVESGGHGRRRCARKLRLGELLDAFGPGQNIVEIEGGEASVRLWVE